MANGILKPLINGSTEQPIKASDRGLNYGDGLFETIAVKQGVALLWDAHIKRLRLGAKRLAIPFTETLEQQFHQDLTALLAKLATKANPSPDAVFKLTLTRGIGARGYKADPNAKVTRISAISAMPDMSVQQEQGIKVQLCLTQLARQPLLAGIKHLNRLEQVIARSEWDDPQISEGIVCDTEGNVIEGCMSNVFWVKGGVLYTPDLSHSGVEGVVRNKLLQLCELHNVATVKIGNFKIAELLSADELFVCNSVFSILPVTDIVSFTGKFEFNQVSFTIGTITTILQQLLQQFYIKES